MGLDLGPGGVLDGVFYWKWGCSVTTNRHNDSTKWSANGRRAHLSRASSSILTGNVRSHSSGSQVVAMMQAAESWHGDDPATRS